MIGQTVAQYKITEKLGAGGMGEVFLAEDAKLQRKVALKFLPERLSQDAEFRARFEHEARAVAALDHPNIVTVHELGEFEGKLFIAMQHLTGKTLAEVIDSDKLSIRKALDLAIQICEGLAAAHKAGIVHRDIKPANILVDDSGRARILDFGLAKSQKATTETKVGSTVGTVQYESPEQSRGEKVDARSDLFSFGVVLYEMITGKLPFAGDYDEAIRYAVGHEAAEPMARYKSDVPSDLESLVTKLLEKEAEMRYPSAEGALPDLKRIVRDLTQMTPEPELATPSAPSAPSAPQISAPKPFTKRFIIPGSIVTLLVVAALVFKPWKFEISPTQEAQASENILAIMYFDNLKDPSDPERLGEMSTNLLITALSDNQNVSILSSQRLYDILAGLGKAGVKSLDRQVATQVAKEAKARWMLTGTILQVEPKLVITTQVIEVETGKVQSSQRSSAEDGEDIFSQLDRLTVAIKDDLAIVTPDGKGTQRLADLTTSSPEAYRYYLEGVDYLYRVRTDAARVSFYKALEYDSTFAMVYYKLTNRWVDDSNFDVNLRKAVRYSANATELERMYILTQADVAAGDFQEALHQLKEIIRKYPDEKIVYLQIAELFSDKLNEPDSARSYLNTTVARFPKFTSPLNLLAYLYKSGRQYDSSLNYINRYVEMVPDEPNPYDSRGEIYAAAGRIDDAIASYSKAIELEPSFSNGHGALTLLHIWRGDTIAANDIYKVSVRQLPSNEDRSRIRSTHALVPLVFGQFERSLQMLRDGIVKDKLSGVRDFSVLLKYYMATEILILLGQYEEAETLGRELNSISPVVDPGGTVSGSNRLALAFSAKGEFDRANDALNSARLAKSERADPFLRSWLSLTQGVILKEEGNYAAAIDTLLAVRDIHPQYVRPRIELELAQVYLKSGEPEKAISIFEFHRDRIETIWYWRPLHSILLHYYLGLAYQGVNRNSEAAESYTRFLERWSGADVQIDEITDAKERLRKLTL